MNFDTMAHKTTTAVKSQQIIIILDQRTFLHFDETEQNFKMGFRHTAWLVGSHKSALVLHTVNAKREKNKYVSAEITDGLRVFPPAV